MDTSEVWDPPILFNQKDLLVVSWARVSVWNPPILFKQTYLLVVSHVCGSKSYKVQRHHQRLPKLCLLCEIHRVQQCPHIPAHFFLFGTEVRILVWPGTSEGDQHEGDVLGRGPNCQHDPTRIHDLRTAASECRSSADSSTSSRDSIDQHYPGWCANGSNCDPNGRAYINLSPTPLRQRWKPLPDRQPLAI